MTNSNLFTPVEACWICGGKRLVPYHQFLYELSQFRDEDPLLMPYNGARQNLMRCKECGFGQPESLPTLERYFDRIYNQLWDDKWMTTEFESGYKDLIFSTVLDQLAAARGGEKGAFLDIGAHVGRLIYLASQRGWNAEGVELNPRTCDFAKRRTGLVVSRTNIYSFVRDGRRFDAVTLVDVLEHIPEPMNVVRLAAQLLNPGGCLVIKVPHGRHQWYKETLRGKLRPGYRPSLADNLVHINHFTPGSLRRALAECGFQEIRVTPGAPEIPPPYVGEPLSHRLAIRMRTPLHALLKAIPFAPDFPLCMHLQACARRAS